jgi:hypothetical protein
MKCIQIVHVPPSSLLLLLYALLKSRMLSLLFYVEVFISTKSLRNNRTAILYVLLGLQSEFHI